MTAKKFLDGAYDLDSVRKTEEFYRDWAATYDAETAENGYVTPQRCAEALADVVEDRSEPLIDIGCGTGLSGAAFRQTGFTNVDGTDLTEEMLAKARARGVYGSVIRGDVTAESPFEPGAYTHAAAVGVMSPGHAPSSLIDDVMRALPSGGCFAFSLNDHALEDPTFQGRVQEHVDTGAAQIAFREYGDHLPKIELRSVVYVLRKA